MQRENRFFPNKKVNPAGLLIPDDLLAPGCSLCFFPPGAQNDPPESTVDPVGGRLCNEKDALITIPPTRNLVVQILAAILADAAG